ncbi:unnamed protein product [Cunninghamella echinulata]
MKNRPHSYISLPTIYHDDSITTTPIRKHPRRKSFQQDDDGYADQKKLKYHYPPLPITSPLSSFYSTSHDPITNDNQHQQGFIMDYFYSKELPPIKRKKKVNVELKSTTIMTGQWIEGNILLDFDLNDIIHLELYLQGIESVMDETFNFSVKTHTHSFLKTTILSLNGFQVDKYNNNPMQRKEWKIPFKYQLPTHFHYSSSYEDKQCAIEYALHCDITARSVNQMMHFNRFQKGEESEEKEFYQTQKIVKLYHHVLPEDLNEFDQPIKEHKRIWENISPSSSSSFPSPSLTMINNDKRKPSIKDLAASPYVDTTINMNRSFWIAGSSLYVTMQIKNHSINTIQDIQLDLIKRQNTYLSSSLTSGFDLMPITSTSETILSTPVSSFDWWYIIEPTQHDHVILSLSLPANEFTIKHQKLIDISYALRISICSSFLTETVTELPIYIIQPHTMEPLSSEKDILSISVTNKEQEQQLDIKKEINEKDASCHSLSTVSSFSSSSHYSAFLPITTSSVSIENKQQQESQQIEQLQKEQKEKRDQLYQHQKQIEQLQKKQKEKKEQLQKQQQQQQQKQLQSEKEKKQDRYYQQQQQQQNCQDIAIQKSSFHIQPSSKTYSSPPPSTTIIDNTKNQKSKKWIKKNIYQWVKKKSHQYFDKQQQQQQNKEEGEEEEEAEEKEILKNSSPINHHHHHILSPVIPTSSYSTPSPSKTRVIHYYDKDDMNPISSPSSSIQDQQPSLISSSGFSSSDSSFSVSTSSFSKKESKKIKTPLLNAKRPFMKKCKSFVSTPTSKHVSFINNNNNNNSNNNKEDSLFFNRQENNYIKDDTISSYSQKLEIPPTQHPSLFLSPQNTSVHPFTPKKKRPTSFYGTSMLHYLSR